MPRLLLPTPNRAHKALSPSHMPSPGPLKAPIISDIASAFYPPPRLTKNQLEDVVVDKEVVTVLGQVEDLSELHRPLLLVDLQLAGHKDNDAAADGGLGVEGGVGEVVLDALEGETLEKV